MSHLSKDLSWARRNLLRAPLANGLAVLSLALAMGVGTVLFAVLHAVLLEPLPVAEPDRLVALYTVDASNADAPLSHLPTSYPNFRDYRERNEVFSDLVAYQFVPLHLTSSGRGERLFGQIVSGDYFSALGVDAVHGRTFGIEEGSVPGGHPVAVLGHGLWSRRFSADPGVIGSVVELNDHPFTIVGVAERGFTGVDAGFAADLWVPMSMHREALGDLAPWFESRSGLLFQVLGRLRPGVSLEQASSRLERLARQLEAEHPDVNANRGVELVPLARARLNPNFRDKIVLGMGLLLAAVGLLLTIASLNTANLLLAQASRRGREVAVRLSLGAGRGALIRQWLTESVLLALAAGAAGLAVALVGLRLLPRFEPSLPLPLRTDLELAPWLLLASLLLSMLLGVAFGLLPALRATRTPVASVLKEQGRGGAEGGQRYGLKQALVLAQVALCIVSLIAAHLFVRSLRRAQEVDPGFAAEELLVVSFDLGLQGYEPARIEGFQERLLERIRSLPGVATASLSAYSPLSYTPLRTVRIPGHASEDGGVFIVTNTVEEAFFRTMEIPVVEGRAFDRGDRRDARQVAVVNETMASRYWPGRSAVGQRFSFVTAGAAEPVEVVGVVADAKYASLTEPPRPYIYRPLEQAPQSKATLVVRSEGDPARLLVPVRRAVAALDPELPLFDAYTLPQLIDKTLWAQRLAAGVLGFFGIASLILSGIGIFGVIAYNVQQRRREIGIRLALGAQRGGVLRMIVGQGMVVVAAGVALGLLGALLLSRVAGSLLFGVSAYSPASYWGMCALLLAVALLAHYVPTRRAVKVEPVEVLKAG